MIIDDEGHDSRGGTYAGPSHPAAQLIEYRRVLQSIPPGRIDSWASLKFGGINFKVTPSVVLAPG